MNFINGVYINNFRNIESLKLDFDSKINLIFGKNGSGKTSILEALSIFSPGRGLRSAKINEMLKKPSGVASKIIIDVDSIGLISANLEKSKKILKINNGQNVSSIEALRKVKFVWLTGKIVSDCIANTANLRSFFDRLFFSFNESYLTFFLKYKKLVRDWNLMVANNCYDERWFYEVEKKISYLSLKIFDFRFEFLLIIQKFLSNSTEICKSSLNISMIGELENFCSDNNTREGKIIDKMRSIRSVKNCISKKFINFGVHKTKFAVQNKEKIIDFNMMSYGEQKSAMAKIVISALKGILDSNNGVKPVLLLDEIISGMDLKHINIVIKDALDLCSQIFITSCSEFEKYNGASMDKISLFNLEKILEQKNSYSLD